ncbi:hypothetical protein FQ775_11915 [Nitratireductor mangrovi]|uniref:Uncharacterized protein n=1 Tax=Nitratireductor mangrovi TaxID=2599600 RepID=A0A5B8KZM8_9HYPH|nr:hypothetical protein [Nitratireductor mangrovi]QDZ01033.1 hypothetical protein FQ775_11915 [Nitratireductor mangrovi]
MSASFFKLTNLVTATAILAGTLAATDIASARDGGGPDRTYAGTIEIGDTPATATPKKKETASKPKPKKRDSFEDAAKIIQTAGAPRRIGLGLIGGVVGDFSCTVVWCIFDQVLGFDTRYTPGDVTRQVMGYEPAKRAPKPKKEKASKYRDDCPKCQEEKKKDERLAAWRAQQKAKRDAAMKALHEEAVKRAALHKKYGGNNYDRHGPGYQMRLGR